jgi:hypothetical protein
MTDNADFVALLPRLAVKKVASMVASCCSSWLARDACRRVGRGCLMTVSAARAPPCGAGGYALINKRAPMRRCPHHHF